MTAQTPRIAIIGAGMAGVTCARLLGEAGFRPTIFEKSRGIGGRLSTRRGESPQGLLLAFDHGAQYITAKTPGFAAELEAAHSAGTAAFWQADGLETAGFRRRYVGQPGMNAPLKHWLDGPAESKLKLGCEIASVTRDGPAWQISFTDGAEADVFDFVISTAPAPQAAKL
ncbi:MAG: NAD(P)-binding protein, partial [Alphaproteobacteria bacterium]|nr:NAD(P)-binding protein [Alphaproteobacteria bacterium]